MVIGELEMCWNWTLEAWVPILRLDVGNLQYRFYFFLSLPEDRFPGPTLRLEIQKCDEAITAPVFYTSRQPQCVLTRWDT